MMNDSYFSLYFLWLFSTSLFISQSTYSLVLIPILYILFFSKDLISFKIEKTIYIFLIIIFLSMFFAGYFGGHGFSPFFYIFNTFVLFLCALLTVDKFTPKSLYYASKFLYFSLLVFMLLTLLYFWGDKEPFAKVIPGSSTNGFPTFLLLLNVFYVSTSYCYKNNVSIIVPLFTIFMAFYGVGRGTLVVSFLLLIFVFSLNMSSKNYGYKSYFKYLFISCFILTLILNFNLIYSFFSLYTKLSVGLVDTNRLEILFDYFNKLTDLQSVLFGADYSNTVISDKYKGNPHIAFVRSHSMFGFIYLFMVFFSPLLILFCGKKFKEIYIYGGCILLFWLRAISEPNLFPAFFDYFYFIIFIIAYKKSVARNVF